MNRQYSTGPTAIEMFRKGREWYRCFETQKALCRKKDTDIAPEVKKRGGYREYEEWVLDIISKDYPDRTANDKFIVKLKDEGAGLFKENLNVEKVASRIIGTSALPSRPSEQKYLHRKSMTNLEKPPSGKRKKNNVNPGTMSHTAKSYTSHIIPQPRAPSFSTGFCTPSGRLKKNPGPEDCDEHSARELFLKWPGRNPAGDKKMVEKTNKIYKTDNLEMLDSMFDVFTTSAMESFLDDAYKRRTRPVPERPPILEGRQGRMVQHVLCKTSPDETIRKNAYSGKYKTCQVPNCTYLMVEKGLCFTHLCTFNYRKNIKQSSENPDVNISLPKQSVRARRENISQFRPRIVDETNNNNNNNTNQNDMTSARKETFEDILEDIAAEEFVKHKLLIKRRNAQNNLKSALKTCPKGQPSRNSHLENGLPMQTPKKLRIVDPTSVPPQPNEKQLNK